MRRSPSKNGAVPTSAQHQVDRRVVGRAAFATAPATSTWSREASPSWSRPARSPTPRTRRRCEAAAQPPTLTDFIPLWVKIAVAVALGLGTMVGWKRIVVTVGEKIGKSHLTYAQGASAELVAMVTIGVADVTACRSARRTSCRPEQYAGAKQVISNKDICLSACAVRRDLQECFQAAVAFS